MITPYIYIYLDLDQGQVSNYYVTGTLKGLYRGFLSTEIVSV